MTASKNKPLVVTTAHRGVFFGYGVPTDDASIRLLKARMCVYWPAAVRSVCGLAVMGPLPGSRVGPAVDVLTLRDVTAVMECAEAAVAVWEAEPWS